MSLKNWKKWSFSGCDLKTGKDAHRQWNVEFIFRYYFLQSPRWPALVYQTCDIQARDLLTVLSAGSWAYEDVASNLWISHPYCTSSVVSVTCVLKTPPYRSTFSPCFTYLHIDTHFQKLKVSNILLFSVKSICIWIFTKGQRQCL